MEPLSKWKMEQQRQDVAASLGESIAKSSGITSPPVDVFEVIQSEGQRLRAFGDDFGEAFDGRLEYQPPSFLLFYNTRYDRWSHQGKHHPKVTFSIGHELGHYYLEWHRAYLLGGGGPHGSWTEFSSDNATEREADSFSTGLLMPEYLLGTVVNDDAPTLSAVQRARDLFDVPLTSILVRWVRLSHFPCAIVAVRNNVIEWGFTSEAFKSIGGHRVHRGHRLLSRSAIEFLSHDPSLSAYRDGQGWSVANSWIDLAHKKLEVHEDYIVVPSNQRMLVFLTARENDLT